MSKLKGYDLSREWWAFAATNEGVRPVHSALYYFISNLYNKLTQPTDFHLPTDSTMQVLGIKNYKTYAAALADLCKWEFISITEKSKNQYTASKITLVKNTKANTEALPKPNNKSNNKANANTDDCLGKKHQSKNQSIDTSIVGINKPTENYIKPLNNNYVNKNLRVGTSFFDLTPFEYFKTHHPISFDKFKLSHAGADFDLLEKKLNQEYAATGFNNENHVLNAVKSILTELIKTENGTKTNKQIYANREASKLQSIGTGATKTFDDGHNLGT